MSAVRVMSTVDELARIQFQIEKLESKAEKIAKKIKQRGAGSYYGKNHVALVYYQWFSSVDMEAVRRKLSERWIRNHTTSKRVRCIRVK